MKRRWKRGCRSLLEKRPETPSRCFSPTGPVGFCRFGDDLCKRFDLVVRCFKLLGGAANVRGEGRRLPVGVHQVRRSGFEGECAVLACAMVKQKLRPRHPLESLMDLEAVGFSPVRRRGDDRLQDGAGEHDRGFIESCLRVRRRHAVTRVREFGSDHHQQQHWHASEVHQICAREDEDATSP